MAGKYTRLGWQETADDDREIQPRQPVDSAVHRININTGEYEAVQGGGEVPDPRVGHTAATVGDDIYVFGGVSIQRFAVVHRHADAAARWCRYGRARGTRRRLPLLHLHVHLDPPFPAY